MKFTTSQKTFASYLAFVSKAVPSRPSHPILANVKLQAKGDSITLTAFDLSLGIEVGFDALISIEGVTTLPSKLLGDIVSRLPDGEITFELDDDGLMVIESSSGRYTLRSMPANEYPELPDLDDAETARIEPDALIQSIKSTLPFVSSEETKQVLTGIHITASDNSIESAATDSKRLSILTASLKNTCNFEVNLPSKAASQLLGMIGDELINISYNQSQMIFEWSGVKITTRLIDGAYPNYKQLIPKDFAAQSTFNRKELLSALERVAVVASQFNYVVNLEFSPTELTILADVQDYGSAKESVKCSSTVGGFAVCFNVSHLIDGLKIINSEEVLFNVNSYPKASTLSPVGEAKHIYTVAPLQARQ